jgi:RNA polymerase subunit RPABC4/transcription elongation factor Spt4
MIAEVSWATIAGLAIGSYVGVLWLALAFSVIRDARHRPMSLVMFALAVLLAFVPPFLGALVYFVLRPPHTIEEERAMEMEERVLFDPGDNGTAPTRPCPHCGREIERAFIICPYCRTQFARRCANCEHTLRLGWMICPYCATEVVMPANARRPPVKR